MAIHPAGLPAAGPRPSFSSSINETKMLEAGLEFEKLPQHPAEMPQSPGQRRTLDSPANGSLESLVLRQLEKGEHPREKFDYKPTVLRRWFLAMLVVFFLALIALTEYSMRTLPLYRNGASEGEHTDNYIVLGGKFDRRQEWASNLSTTTTSTQSSITGPVIVSLTTTEQIKPPPTTTAGVSYLSGIIIQPEPPVTEHTSAATPAQSQYLLTKPKTTTLALDGDQTIPGVVVTVPFRPSLQPSTTVFEQLVTLPESTGNVEQTAIDSAGETKVTQVLTTFPGSVTVAAVSVTLQPGQSWDVRTSQVTTAVGGTLVTQLVNTTDSAGQATVATQTVLSGATTTVVPTTFGTVVGTPIATPPAGPSGGDDEESTHTLVIVLLGISWPAYMTGSFLPTILALLLNIPLKLISVNTRLFQPFVNLAAAGPAGAPAAASVFLNFNGWRSLLTLPTAVRLGQPVLVLAEMILVAALLLAPIAASAVDIHIPTGCTSQCPGTLGMDATIGRVLQALMVLLVLLLVGVAVCLRWFHTGVRQNPWSIAGMAALGLDAEFRALLGSIPTGLDRKVADAEVLAALEGRRYKLDHGPWNERYGIMVARCHDPPRPMSPETRRPSGKVPPREADGGGVERGKCETPFLMMTCWVRGLMLFVYGSFVAILAYYENSSGDSGFERFMESQGYGVRFFFTGLGVIIAASMGLFFQCIAVLSPYLLLSKGQLPAQRSILISPPTNPYTGLISAFRQRHLYLGFVAFAAILADVLPVTLAHVPFSLMATADTQITCAYLSIAILAVLFLAVAGSYLPRWPHMPVDPRTIAGLLFYVHDSRIMASFDGLSVVSRETRNKMLQQSEAKYVFGEMAGMSANRRMGIDEWHGSSWR